MWESGRARTKSRPCYFPGRLHPLSLSFSICERRIFSQLEQPVPEPPACARQPVNGLGRPPPPAPGKDFMSLRFDSLSVKARYQYTVLPGLREGEVTRAKSPARGQGFCSVCLMDTGSPVDRCVGRHDTAPRALLPGDLLCQRRESEGGEVKERTFWMFLPISVLVSGSEPTSGTHPLNGSHPQVRATWCEARGSRKCSLMASACLAGEIVLLLQVHH